MFLDLGIDSALHFQRTPTTPDTNQDEPQTQASPDELGSPLFYVAFNRWMTRQWKPGMTYAERAILDFVFDRTVGWGKEWEAMPLRHMAEGFGQDGPQAWASNGTGISRAALIPALARLLDKGVIRKQEGSGRAADKFAINFNWTPDTDTPTFRQAMLRLPKDAKKQQPQTPRFAPDEGRSGQPTLPMRSTRLTRNRDTNKESNQESATQTGEAPAGLPGISASRFAGIVAEVKKQGEQRAEKAKASSRFTVQGLQAIFNSEWSAAFPETPVVAWKQHEGFALKQWGARYQSSTRLPFAELFSWCVSRWRQIMAHQFRTFKAAPDFPAVGFMVKFADRFQDAYARRAELERRASMTERETAIERAKDKGMDEDTAERHADERLGLSEQREALKKERRRLLAQQLAVPRLVQPPPMQGAGASRVRVENNFKTTKPALSDMLRNGTQEFPPYEQ